jgi:uncharacterized protein YbjT (DUF2867 family)
MILVVGATGQLGGTIARELLGRGKSVRILARPASAYQPLAERGAEVALGDLRDPASLAEACRGTELVVTTANSARRSGDDTVEAVDLTGTRNLIEAAAAAGVARFIYTSVLGVTENSPVPFLAAKARNEAWLRASGMAWTILAPNFFQEWWPAVVVGKPAAMGRPVMIVGEGRRKHAFVSERDVAAFAVAAADGGAAVNRHLPIGGPEALSWRDVTSVYERLLGRPLEIRVVEPGEPVPGLPPAVLHLLAALDTYDSAFDTRALAAEFGVRLTPFEEVARSMLAGAGASH